MTTRDAAYDGVENRAAIAAAAEVLAVETGVVTGLRETRRRDYLDAIGAELVFEHLVEHCHRGDRTRAEAAVWQAYFADGGESDESLEVEEAVRRIREAVCYADSRITREMHCTERYRDACRVVSEMPASGAARVVADFLVTSVAW